ncbi:MAG: hypothetical protein CMC74_13770 [Flavobacteriaceae bacterium]|nr:hypothetical protein [Flavobacteriaceae bacterium]|tara:strand:+ start:78673 stop:78978 length:306 start_codon:yes stop_codon:yes gene_type:complete
MKLLIVTVVDEFHKEAMQLFKKAHIERFSGSDIDGYKEAPSFLMNTSWFPSERGGTESNMYFSFTEEAKIDTFFELVTEFNKHLETDNPIKAIVVPIEKYI